MRCAAATVRRASPRIRCAKWQRRSGVLADVQLKTLRETPSVPYEKDEVTRVVEDSLDAHAYQQVAGWTVAEFREWLLDDRTTGEDIAGVTLGLTPEMVAAVAKLMSNMDLVMPGGSCAWWFAATTRWASRAASPAACSPTTPPTTWKACWRR